MWSSLNHGLTAEIIDPGWNRTWLFYEIVTKNGAEVCKWCGSGTWVWQGDAPASRILTVRRSWEKPAWFLVLLTEGNLHLLLLCPVPPCASSAPSVSGYRHVYLEGIEEASIFVHVAINDICGKVSVCAVQHPHRSCQDLVSHRVKVQEEIFVHSE